MSKPNKADEIKTWPLRDVCRTAHEMAENVWGGNRTNMTELDGARTVQKLLVNALCAVTNTVNALEAVEAKAAELLREKRLQNRLVKPEVHGIREASPEEAARLARMIGKSAGEDEPEPGNLSFRLFCRNATNTQLENILMREWKGADRDPDRMSDYNEAALEAERRGWTVKNGERL